MLTLRLLILYGLPIAAAAALAAWLGRPIPRRALAAFAALPLLFTFPGFFQGRTILPVGHVRMIVPWSSLPSREPAYNANLNDAVTQLAPWEMAVRMSWKEGSLPLRNRWNGCGIPLAANGQSAAFAPWTFWGFLAPLAFAFNLIAALKLFAALTGAWLWLRELGVRPMPAVLGACAFALSFTMTMFLLFPLASAAALFPWILFTVERLRDRRRSGRAFALLIVLLTAWALSGHLETVSSFALLAAVWLAIRVAAGDFPREIRIWRSMAAAALLAGALATFALLPQALALVASNRWAQAARPFWASALSWKPHGARWPAVFLTLFPRSLGDAIGAPMLPEAPAAFSEMGLGSIGVVGAACVCLVLRPGSRRRRACLAMLVPLGFGLCAGAMLWPFAEIAGILPGLGRMFPVRWLSWAAVAASLIAAFEVDRLVDDLRRRKDAAVFLGLGLAAIAGLGIFWFARHRAAYASLGETEAQGRALVVSLAVSGVGLVFASAAAGWPKLRRGLPLFLVVLSAGELFQSGRRLYRFGPPEELFPVTPLVAFLRAQPPPFRVLGEGSALFPSSNVFAGVEEVRTHDAIERDDYVRLLDACCGYDPAAYFKRLRDVNAPMLDYLNVRYLISTPGRAAPAPRWRLVYSGIDGTVFENAAVRPRVFAAEGSGPAVVEYTERTNRARIRFRDAPLQPVPFQTSLVDDGGWSARSGGGRLLEKTRRYPPFLSFDLPGGEREVRLAYSPPGFLRGSAISLSALSAVLAWMVHRWWPGRRVRGMPVVSEPE